MNEILEECRSTLHLRVQSMAKIMSIQVGAHRHFAAWLTSPCFVCAANEAGAPSRATDFNEPQLT